MDPGDGMVQHDGNFESPVPDLTAHSSFLQQQTQEAQGPPQQLVPPKEGSEAASYHRRKYGVPAVVSMQHTAFAAPDELSHASSSHPSGAAAAAAVASGLTQGEQGLLFMEGIPRRSVCHPPRSS
jgi:hypothetical protein